MRSHRSLLSLSCLALLGAASQDVSARTPICDPVEPTGNQWIARWPTTQGDDCDGGSSTQSFLMEQYDIPGPVVLNCEDMGNGFLCEAFPQSDDGITYTWSTTGAVYQPYPNDPLAPMKQLGCSQMGQSGTVTVTVRSPYGVTATKSQSLYCGW